ncbi:unnamed protein product [Bursaphelenchus xylophilus]|uniref:(pine wood nematode) hypothetical protein n=1 Tax=Bursaphelenchus xylophilus TaxID=6326 RepID=A0A1I7SIC8_BURXY|nr:unnamed protein product [Bursaphelenchus xylophilus]CAG9106088.1 unnamed protein product [Bursaphelenchus xylophilus]
MMLKWSFHREVEAQQSIQTLESPPRPSKSRAPSPKMFFERIGKSLQIYRCIAMVKLLPSPSTTIAPRSLRALLIPNGPL